LWTNEDSQDHRDQQVAATSVDHEDSLHAHHTGPAHQDNTTSEVERVSKRGEKQGEAKGGKRRTWGRWRTYDWREKDSDNDENKSGSGGGHD
jgi:hypothetical protein